MLSVGGCWEIRGGILMVDVAVWEELFFSCIRVVFLLVSLFRERIYELTLFMFHL